MSLLPLDVDYLKNAGAAAARLRGLRPLLLTKVSNDFTVALKCIGAYQTFETNDELKSLDNEDEARPLIAAGRTLLSLAQTALDLDSPDDAHLMRLHAALAFAMQGNFPNSKAAIREVPEDFLFSTSTRFIAAVVCDPVRMLHVDIAGKISWTAREFFANFYDALTTADDMGLSRALEYLTAATNFENSSDASLLLSIHVGSKQALRLSIAQLRNSAPEIPAWFIDGAISSGTLTLLPPQYVLLSERNIAASKDNALLNLPTSTGKTLIAEACMAASTQHGGISFFVAPYVAIGNQVMRSLQGKATAGVEVISMFGGYFAKRIPRREHTSVLVVATPERFDAWLRAGEDIERLRLVVFDEVHHIENGSRGARLEGLISRLRLLQQRLLRLRVIGISAVLPGANIISEWLNVSDDTFHALTWRPTARRLAVCSPKGMLTWIHGTDILRPKTSDVRDEFAYGVSLDLNLVAPDYTFVSKASEFAASENVAKISMDLSFRLGGCGLIVCPRRTDTRQIAATVSSLIQDFDINYKLAEFANKLRQSYSWLENLAENIEKGVAYHNASLPHDVRRGIEDLVHSGDLRFVAATSTLAEGADFPFRWTLVSHWLTGVHPTASKMKSLTFRNIAGRSGRAGYYTEGDTIIFQNTLGGRAAVGPVRLISEEVNDVMFSVTPLVSPIGDKDLVINPEIERALVAAYGSQLLASVQENPHSDDIVTLLVSATYAAVSGTAELLKRAMSQSLADALDNNAPGGAFAVQNSPVRLTEVGAAANKSGFSPSTCREILKFVDSANFANHKFWLLAQVLGAFSSVPEQQDTFIAKIFNGNKAKGFMKSNDIAIVIEKHINKIPLREIFDELPARLKSKGQSDFIEKEFDKFVQIVDSSIPNFLPWMLRGIATMAPFSTRSAIEQPNWASLADSWNSVEQNDMGNENLNEDSV